MNRWNFAGWVTMLALACVPAMAQQIYRIVGPDGRVTFADQPAIATSPQVPASAAVTPATGAAAATAAGPTAAATAGVPGLGALPFDLRQIASRYPVTLITGSSCNACASGRALLSQRGVPFIEKTVDSAEDTDALQRLSGETTLPFLTLGSQQIKGFSETEWGQYLDAAGYPRSSLLPTGYRQPPATPLAGPAKAEPVKAAAEPVEGAIRPLPPPPPPSNPAGIKF